MGATAICLARLNGRVAFAQQCRLNGFAKVNRIGLGGRWGRSLCCARTSDDEDVIDKDFQIKAVTRDDVAISFARSSGPGGQNVNKLNTKVDMRLNLKNSTWIPQPVVEALHQREKNRINKDGDLVVTSTKSRTQMANIDDAIVKIQDILEGAVESVRPREIDPAKQKKLAKQRKKANEVRIQQKKQKSSKKKDRKVSRKDW